MQELVRNAQLFFIDSLFIVQNDESLIRHSAWAGEVTIRNA
jgi:hypothetical protein